MPTKRRPAHIVLLDKIEALGEELEPVTGSLADPGVLQSFLGIAAGVPYRAALYISLLAEITLTEKELETVQSRLQEIIASLESQNAVDQDKCKPEPLDALDYDPIAHRIGIRREHIVLLISLRSQHGLA